jgi:alkylhydroperoxidase family enzyme
MIGGMAWIKTIDYEESDGALRAEYDRAVRRAGKVYNIVGIMGLRPLQLKASMGFYGALMHGRAGLGRAQREMLAVVVSQVNQCHY